ncbi:MAG TPA: hypothetical protein ENF67_01715, partial [Candidatus Pacearchaeota archaeon]|nr:hypothetical protein [Candidatus Pacearchaeota archaeon]
MKKAILMIFLLSLIIFLSHFILAFDFYGYTKYENGTILPHTNITVIVYYLMNHTEVANFSDQSDSSGRFNITIPGNYTTNYSFKPVVRHFNGQQNGVDLVDYVGPSLPDLPYEEFSNIENITFFMKEAVTVKITAFGKALPDKLTVVKNNSVDNYT